MKKIFQGKSFFIMVFLLLIGLIGAGLIFGVNEADAEKRDNLFSSFGTGRIGLRIYSDYFCGPCRVFESKLDPVINELVVKGIATVTFIDTPFHRSSALYAKYFLYILNDKKDFQHAVAVRNILFDAAKENITDEDKLDKFLKKKGLKPKPFDPKPVFSTYKTCLNEDKIDATPSVVIYHGENKEVHKGGADILKALEGLKEEKPGE